MENYDLELLLQYVAEHKFRLLRSRLAEMNEADIAEFMEEVDDNQKVLIFRMLPKELAADVFACLEPDIQEHIINSITDAEIHKIIEDLFVDDAVDMLEELPATVVKRVMRMAAPETRKLINQFLQYPDNSAGSIMTAEYIGLKKYIHNGKIFTTFNQTVTATGRLSSSDPNLQNISIKDEEGKEIRKAFVAPKGYKLISADYSQIELRMLAHMANEYNMIDAFKHDIDIHTKTASELFDVSPDEVDEHERRIAKTVNFGIIYGQTEFGLSQTLHISRQEAKKFMRTYFASYPNIHRFMDQTIEFCEENGYVETMLHRRRAIPEIHDKNFMTKEFGKRAAMNAPIQGSAADLIKIAMIKTYEAINSLGYDTKMLLQIHDELIFVAPDHEVEEIIALVQKTMDEAMQLNVPLKAGISYGQNWYEAK